MISDKITALLKTGHHVMFSQENLSENMVILVGNNVGYIQSFISSDALANPGKHLEDNIEFLLEKMHREMPRLESSL